MDKRFRDYNSKDCSELTCTDKAVARGLCRKHYGKHYRLGNIENIKRTEHKRCKKLTEAQAAYIAGILDGEGHVGLASYKDAKLRAGRGYRPRLVIENTSKSLIDYLSETTGIGLVYFRLAPNKKWKDLYIWSVWGSSQTSSLLEQVLSFLVIKQEQSKLLLDFASKCNKSHGNLGMPPELLIYQEQSYDKCKALNKRGRAA